MSDLSNLSSAIPEIDQDAFSSDPPAVEDCITNNAATPETGNQEQETTDGDLIAEIGAAMATDLDGAFKLALGKSNALASITLADPTKLEILLNDFADAGLPSSKRNSLARVVNQLVKESRLRQKQAAKEESAAKQAEEKASQKQPAKQKPTSTKVRFLKTDTGNAQRIVSERGNNLRYCHPWKEWLVWDGTRWCRDNTGAVPRMVKELTIELLVKILERTKDLPPDDPAQLELEQAKKHIVSWQDARTLKRSIELAQSEAGIPILPESLNADPYLLNCSNGTLNLKTGRLQPHRRDDLLTQLCPTAYDSRARCPRFLEAVNAIFNNDQGVIDFVQRSIGYALTGVVTEHILPIWFGGGSNGKSTLIDAILGAIGLDYAGTVPSDLLMMTSSDQHPTGMADLFGKRLMIASETGEGKRLNEERIKMLTGGDRIKARRMRENFWEFSPTHKLIMITNHKPQVRGSDYAIWRRLRLIPFNVRFLNPDDPANKGKDIPKQLRMDKTLGAALRQERPGILNWLVQGCLAWQRDGLPMPESIAVATSEYRSDEDTIGAFIAETCATGDPSFKVKFSTLQERYNAWCKSSNESPVSHKKLGASLTERGFESYPSNGIWYRKIMLNPMTNETEGWKD